jgi:hypothetical protein
VVYDKLARYADAEAVLSKMKAEDGDTSAYQYATIYSRSGAIRQRRSNGSRRRGGCGIRAWRI